MLDLSQGYKNRQVDEVSAGKHFGVFHNSYRGIWITQKLHLKIVLLLDRTHIHRLVADSCGYI